MTGLWDSLDPAAAAPLTPSRTADLDRRETEADADPDAGVPWAAFRDELQAGFAEWPPSASGRKLVPT